MKEPSLLDYVKAKLMPWKYSISERFFDLEEDEKIDSKEIVAPLNQEVVRSKKDTFNLRNLKWLGILFFAFFGQQFLEPSTRQIPIAVAFYLMSFILILWEVISDKNSFFYENTVNDNSLNMTFSKKQINLLIASVVFLVLAFFAFYRNEMGEIFFNFLNLFLWFTSIILFLLATLDFQAFREKVIFWKKQIKTREIQINVKPWGILLFVATLIAFYFRFYQLDNVLGEMFSDHAEKLYDVYDVLTGKFPVFFVRNTGREFFQFYWTALWAIIFRTGISFMSLKIGTALAGFLTLPYIYLLGKELRNKWVGIIAFLLAGIAYWPNVISRVGLRFPFYPLFVAPTLFYLIRGLRQRRRNDFVYAGIALGIGLHGYSSTRFLPVVVVIAIILFLVHKHSKGIRSNTINAFITLVLGSFILFLPLFKFTLVNPEVVTYRTMTRMTSAEREISEPLGKIFIENFWKANSMFFYSNGGTWVHSIPNRPALDIISAGLYFIGLIIVGIQYLKFRNWEDIFLVLAIPLLLMPSILSIAFPDENPSLNRTGGAYVIVFIIAAIGLEYIFVQLWRTAKKWPMKVLSIGLVCALFVISILSNYDLVFNQFKNQFLEGAWNTSQLGSVIKGFAQSTGNLEDAYVVPSPHWVDTRLVGINAGYPTKDYALWPDQFDVLVQNPNEKLVILKPDNQEALTLLKELFPLGILYNYDSGYEGKDFYIYHIPPSINVDINQK